MKPSPKGWPRVTSSVFYDDASAAIDWLCRTFGFEVRLKVEGENGRIEHSELTFADGLVCVGSTGGSSHRETPLPGKSPRALGGANTQSLCIYLDDVDAHHNRVVRAGAKVTQPLTTNDYGDEYWSDRSYGVLDLEGHLWFFVQRVREQK